MKKKIIWISILLLFIISLILVSLYLDDRYKEESIEKVTEQEKSKIKQITSQNFEQEIINSNKITVIDFYADWCFYCVKLTPIIQEVTNERDDINFVRVDVDDETDLANQYGITSIPALVVIKDGKEVNRSLGYISKENIEKLVNTQ